jgi:hypothetical protein
MFQAFTISDVITDVIILAIPIYWTLKEQMSIRRKLAVSGVFLLGAVCVKIKPHLSLYTKIRTGSLALELLASSSSFDKPTVRLITSAEYTLARLLTMV